ncbi:MAG: heme biosynthesis protein HemY [Rhodobacteraceae bacterium]|nr:heme biosynthesis protein HemY [Paracoccaceae bacterium]
MLWSLIRIFLFVGAITAAAFGAAFLLETGGEVRLSFGGVEYTFEPLVALIGLVVLLLGCWLLLKLIGLMVAVFRFFNGDETAVSRFFMRNRERRGFDALADGMVALAAGEGKTAVAKAAKAERYLERPELTHLINAQAAEMNGDTKRALKYYKNLLQNDRTRFVGVQGIMKQKLAEGDTDTALKLAEKAFALRPQHDPTLETLFSLQTDKEEWSGARKTIEAKVRASTLPRDVGRRRDAVLSLADAKRLLDAGEITTGKEAALQANKLSADLIPAAVLAAEMQTLDNNKRAAVKIVKKAWTGNPHPDLAAAFAEIEPDETPAARLRRFGPILKLRPDHSESKMLQAELMLTAEDFPGARRAIGALADAEPTARSLTIMAAIARGEGAEENVVRSWLSKALNASRGSQWICSACNKIHLQWSPKCGNCAGFDTMDWKTPPESDDLGAATTMLPFMGTMLSDPNKTESDAEEAEPLEASSVT